MFPSHTTLRSPVIVIDGALILVHAFWFIKNSYPALATLSHSGSTVLYSNESNLCSQTDASVLKFLRWAQCSDTLAFTSVNEEQTCSGNGIPANAIQLAILKPITICIYTIVSYKPYLPPGPRL